MSTINNLRYIGIYTALFICILQNVFYTPKNKLFKNYSTTFTIMSLTWCYDRIIGYYYKIDMDKPERMKWISKNMKLFIIYMLFCSLWIIIMTKQYFFNLYIYLLTIIYVFIIKSKILGFLKSFYLGCYVSFTIYLISYFIENKDFEIQKLLPIGLIISANCMGWDISDKEGDKANKIYTLPVLIGNYPTRLLSATLIAISMTLLNNINFIIYLFLFFLFQKKSFTKFKKYNF